MRIIKAIFHGAFIGLLGLLTVLSITIIVIIMNLTNRDIVKSWPAESGLYNNVTNQLLALLKQQGEDGQSFEQALGEGLLDEERIKVVLGEVLPPEYWKTTVENVLDPTFDWLEGKAPELQFSVPLSAKANELADAMGKEIETQLANAPKCPSGQNQEDFDVLTAKCLPAGVSPASAAATFSNQLKGPDSPLDEIELSSDKLELPERLRDEGPNDFARLKMLPWILGGILVFLILVAGFTGKNVLYGFRRVGQVLFSTGALSWLSFYLIKRFGNSFKLNTDNPDELNIFNNVVNPLVKTIINSVTTTGLWVSLVVVIIGVLIWLATFIWHKVHHEPAAKTSSGPGTDKEATLPKPVAPKAENKKT